MTTPDDSHLGQGAGPSSAQPRPAQPAHPTHPVAHTHDSSQTPQTPQTHRAPQWRGRLLLLAALIVVSTVLMMVYLVQIAKPNGGRMFAALLTCGVGFALSLATTYLLGRAPVRRTWILTAFAAVFIAASVVIATLL